jgi:hypothetical protein
LLTLTWFYLQETADEPTTRYDPLDERVVTALPDRKGNKRQRKDCQLQECSDAQQGSRSSSRPLSQIEKGAWKSGSSKVGKASAGIDGAVVREALRPIQQALVPDTNAFRKSEAKWHASKSQASTFASKTQSEVPDTSQKTGNQAGQSIAASHSKWASYLDEASGCREAPKRNIGSPYGCRSLGRGSPTSKPDDFDHEDFEIQTTWGNDEVVE